MRASSHWAGILAGGDGTRLQSFTRTLTGDDRPKQFCRLLTKDTLLGTTRARLSPLVEPERTLYVVTRHHARYYREELRDVPWYAMVEQPMGRGTTAAVAYAVARLAAIDPDATLALFPADHHFEHPSVLRQYVATAYAAAAADPNRAFLLGAHPDGPEPSTATSSRRVRCRTSARVPFRADQSAACTRSSKSRRSRTPRCSSDTAACGTPSSSWPR